MLYGWFVLWWVWWDNVTFWGMDEHDQFDRMICTVGYCQLLAYMVGDTIDNYTSVRPRIENYVHHAICTIGIVGSLYGTRANAPLYIFGTLEIISVIRLVELYNERLFCWLRILATMFVRFPVCCFGIWYCIERRLIASEHIIYGYTEMVIWQTIVTLVIPFDIYLTRMYVKRLHKCLKQE